MLLYRGRAVVLQSCSNFSLLTSVKVLNAFYLIDHIYVISGYHNTVRNFVGPITKAQTARFLTLENAKKYPMKARRHCVTKAHIQNKSNPNLKTK